MMKLLNGTSLKVIAMTSMVMDHAMKIFGIHSLFLTIAGRLAFPIFAFLLAEGYAHTSNVNRYTGRLLFWAVLTEIPFDMAFYGEPFMFRHQNVLWTFLISLLMLRLYDRFGEKEEYIGRLISMMAVLALGMFLGVMTMCDYSAVGVLMVLMFWFLRGNTVRHCILQVMIVLLFSFLLTSSLWAFDWNGAPLFVPVQVFCLLALPLIWLYNGKPGYRKKWFQTLCYAFYPGHLLILFGLQFVL